MHMPWREVSLGEGPFISTSVTVREAAELAGFADGQAVLEIGSAFGYSAVMMALAGGQVTAIDPHSEIPGSLETMTANVAAYGVAGRVAILCETSYSAMPRLAAGEASFGLIFVDGDHQAEAVRHDAGWALRLLAPGGVLACHDYGEECCCPGVRQALDELFPEGGELTDSLFVVRR